MNQENQSALLGGLNTPVTYTPQDIFPFRKTRFKRIKKQIAKLRSFMSRTALSLNKLESQKAKIKAIQEEAKVKMYCSHERIVLGDELARTDYMNAFNDYAEATAWENRLASK